MSNRIFLRRKYTEETGKDAVRLPHEEIPSYTSDYIRWLEGKYFNEIDI